MTLAAQLFPAWSADLAAYTDKYNVALAGEIIVERSRDPETDLARALLARGHSGKVTMLDGATGKPRTIIDIEKAATVRTVETGTYPRFRRIERYAESPPAAETQVVGMDAPQGQILVLVTHKGGEF